MPKTKEQFEEIRALKTEMIEEAALASFALMGFHNASIAAIAKKAGISTGLMYNYFESKDDLLKVVYLKGISKIFDPLLRTKSVITHEEFTGFINHVLDQMKTNPTYWKTYIMVLTQPGVLIDYSDLIINGVMEGVKRITEYFTKQGYDDPELECKMLLSVLDGVCLNYVTDTANYPIEKIREKILKQYEK